MGYIHIPTPTPNAVNYRCKKCENLIKNNDVIVIDSANHCPYCKTPIPPEYIRPPASKKDIIIYVILSAALGLALIATIFFASQT